MSRTQPGLPGLEMRDSRKSEPMLPSLLEFEDSRTAENANMQTDDTLLRSEDHRISDSRNVRTHSHSSDVTSTSPDVERVAESASELVFTCPICGQERAYSSLEDFNQHIDVCLNKSAIQEILQNGRQQVLLCSITFIQGSTL